jgi:hypothetical protein
VYEKLVASLRSSKDLAKFSLVCNEYNVAHPRIRIQLIFALTLLTFLGSRPGEITESHSWKDTNAGLVYRLLDREVYEISVAKEARVRKWI